MKTWFSWQNSYFNNSSWKVFSWTFDKRNAKRFFLDKRRKQSYFDFSLYFRQYMFLFVEKLMLLIRYVWNGKCYKTLPALNIFSFCWIMVTWHFFLKKVYRLNDPIKYCLMFDRGNVEIRHKATLLNMASCWYFMFTPSLFS